MNETITQKQRFNADKASLGFWIYLMSDLMIFASLFATFQVLRHNTAGGPSGEDIFDIPYVLIETVLLLCSSVTAGISCLAYQAKKPTLFRALLSATIVLGIGFLAMELSEFAHLALDGDSWQDSGFLSAYFTLVGTHGLHILLGLIWAAALLIVSFKRPLGDVDMTRKLNLFTIFWHFLDLVWIFIFTVVYLAGVV